MKVLINGNGIEVTASIQERADELFGKLDKRFPAEFVQLSFKEEGEVFDLSVQYKTGKDLIIVSQKYDDVYAGINKLQSVVSRKLEATKAR